MAEVIGLVSAGAGLLSLAIQLGDSAFKLKKFYSQTKDAPQAILDLSHDLETVSLALQLLEQHRQHGNLEAALLDRCIAKCESSTNKINALMGKLEQAIARHRGFGRMYVTFKMQDVMQLVGQLEYAKSDLMMAYQMYTSSCQIRRQAEQDRISNQQLDMLARQDARIDDLRAAITAQAVLTHETQRAHLVITEQRQGGVRMCKMVHASDSQKGSLQASAMISVEEDDDKSERMVARQRPATKRSALNTFHLRISFLSWMTQKIWELSGSQAESGWNFALRTWNFRPDNAPIFRACRDGDLVTMQMLLRSREASVFDFDAAHRNLLEIAAWKKQLHVCRYLLFETALASDDIVTSAFAAHFGYCTREVSRELCRLYVIDYAMNVDFGSNIPDWWIECDDVESLDMILRKQSIPYVSIPPEERFAASFTYTFTNPGGETLILCKAGLKTVTQEFATYKDAQERTPLHHAAEVLGVSICGWNWGTGYGKAENMKFLQELIVSGANPCALDCGHFTPYQTMLRRLRVLGPGPEKCVDITQAWVGALFEAGLDLEQYILEESSHWNMHRPIGFHITSTNGQKNCTRSFLLHRPLLNSKHELCSVEISFYADIPIYELLSAPGAWPEDNRYTPRIIACEPNVSEEDEGRWIESDSSLRLEAKILFDARDYTTENNEYGLQVDGVQDDVGPIALRVNWRKRAASRKRSSSAPPPLHRFEVHGTPSRSWLPSYHLCPYDSRLRFNCCYGRWSCMPIFVRDCAQGRSNVHESVQDTEQWRYQSIFGRSNEGKLREVQAEALKNLSRKANKLP